jgi:hypothetical protein
MMSADWKKLAEGILDKLLHGASMKNAGAQRKMFSVWLQPEIEDQLARILELSPKDWFVDNGAVLKRCIVLTGLEVFLAILESDPTVKLTQRDQKKLARIRKALSDMNVIARAHRNAVLEKQAQKAVDEIARGPHPRKGAMLDRLCSANDELIDALRD